MKIPCSSKAVLTVLKLSSLIHGIIVSSSSMSSPMTYPKSQPTNPPITEANVQKIVSSIYFCLLFNTNIANKGSTGIGKKIASMKEIK